jgi:hypothetical protein
LIHRIGKPIEQPSMAAIAKVNSFEDDTGSEVFA